MGRVAEQAFLAEAWRDAASGRGQLILLEGEPGIGKTRLAEEFCRELEHPSVWSHCWVLGGAPAFWVFKELLTGLGERLADAFASIGVRDNEGPGLGGLSPEERCAMFHRMEQRLCSVAEESPLLWIIDDVHAADKASLELLCYIARRLRHHAIMVIATCRSVARGTDPDSERRLAELAHVATQLPLGGLHADDVAHYVLQRLGRSLVPTLVAALVDATRGNPLFLDGVTRAAQVEGGIETLQRKGWRVASDVAAAIEQRLERAGSLVSRVLQAGAVLGQTWTPKLVAVIAELSLDDTLDALDVSEAEGLVVGMNSSRPRIGFAHQLIQEAIYQGLSRATRRALHQRVFRVLEHDGHAEASERLKHHLAAGDPEGRALDLAHQAARRDRQLLAYEAAADHYRTALSLAAPEQQGPLLLGLGDCELRTGSPKAGRAHFIQAAQLAEHLGDSIAFAQAALAVSRTAEFGVPDLEIRGLVESASQRLPEQHRALHIQLAARLAEGMWLDPQSEARRDALSAGALTMARKENDESLLGSALIARMKAVWGAAHTAERDVLTEEFSRIAFQSTSLGLHFEACRWRINSLWERGCIAQANRELEHYQKLAERLKSPHAMTNALLRRIVAAELSGQLNQIASLLSEFRKHAIEAEHPHAEVFDAMAQLLLRVERGGPEAIRPHVSEYVQVSDRLNAIPAGRCLKPYVYWLVGDHDRARVALHQVWRASVPATYGEASGLCALALVASDVGQSPALCEELYGRLAPFAKLNATAGLGVTFGSVERYLGLLAARRPQAQRACEHLERAISANGELGAPGLRAHCLYELAGVLRSQREEASADRLALEALSEAKRLGFTTLQSRIEGAVWSSTTPASQAPDPLPSSATAVLVKEGEGWHVEGGERRFHLKDRRGLNYLMTLIENPGCAFPAWQLAGDSSPESHVLARQSGFEVLDAEARAQYRERLEALRDEEAEATRRGDSGHVARARSEREFLEEELLRATGLGGRQRQKNSRAERARVSVTNALRRAISAIEAQAPSLGSSLNASVRTGSLCTYDPSRSQRWSWTTIVE